MNHLTSHQIQDSLDGMLTNEAELHLRICPECQSKLNTARTIERTLHSIPLEAASAGFTERVMQNLGIKTSPSLAWTILRNIAPLVALTVLQD